MPGNIRTGFIDMGGIIKMKAQVYFEQHAEEIIDRWAGKNVVLFFRGFVPGNVRWLAQREDALLPAEQILNEDGTISIVKIDAARRKLIQKLMIQEGVRVGIYEEMLAILHTVQDPKAIFDAEFIVVDNDAFPAYVPSCIPSVDAEALYQAYETEKANFTPETEVLSHYYASVRTLDNRYYVALFNRHSLMIFDKHANLKYKYVNRHFWCRGYYVDTVGKYEGAIRDYIRNQLQDDIANDQLSLKEFVDPFTGGESKEGIKMPPSRGRPVVKVWLPDFSGLPLGSDHRR